jgi:hypothetical protein
VNLWLLLLLLLLLLLQGFRHKQLCRAQKGQPGFPHLSSGMLWH